MEAEQRRVVSFAKDLLAFTIACLPSLNSSRKNQTPICMFVVENNIPRTISQQYDPYYFSMNSMDSPLRKCSTRRSMCSFQDSDFMIANKDGAAITLSLLHLCCLSE